MAISEFVDGTTPLDASHLNALVGRVNDLTDQIDGKVNFKYYALGSGGTFTLNYNNFCLGFLARTSYGFFTCTQWNDLAVSNTAAEYADISLSSKTLTISSNRSSYVAIFLIYN